MSNRRSHKWIIIGFVLFLFGVATLGIVKSRKTEEFIEKQIPNGNLDSIISAQVDYRLMSYDYYFMYDNSIVVDSANNIIGRIVLYTNKDEVKKYWEGDSARTKTDLYRKLIEGKLRILEKEPDRNKK